ncbi:MAG: hypothetical protein RL254_803 [Planctomycetota bacterium]|jgi:hypothetical protein
MTPTDIEQAEGPSREDIWALRQLVELRSEWRAFKRKLNPFRCLRTKDTDNAE